MEPRFEATFVPNRRMCNEFGAITSRKQKASWFLLGSSLFLVLYPLFLLLYESTVYYVSQAIGVGFFFLWLLTGQRNGRSIYRSLHKRLQNASFRYVFDHDEVHITNELESVSVRYQAFISILESPHLFALYVAPNGGHIIPKEALQNGTLEEFRVYLEEKTGKRVQQVKGERSPGVTWLLGIGVSVLAIAVLVGATLGRKAIENRPVVFSQGGYSITLPAGFWQVTNDDIPWFISQAGDVSVWVERQEAGPLYEAWGTPLTAKELVQNMNEGLEEEIEFYDLDNGAACYTCSYGEGEVKSFYFEVVMKSEDVFWFTEFECAQEIASVYQEQFLQWAETITIAPEA